LSRVSGQSTNIIIEVESGNTKRDFGK